MVLAIRRFHCIDTIEMSVFNVFGDMYITLTPLPLGSDVPHLSLVLQLE